ncbi:hypothetical protein ABT297_40305 [Dactylosporangium sp. NPDC000555]|uniref:hypothetical protein n=1 Tax=Dactylosporangium sp. NPDC000555 TaxID=3154260 RepID=UPI003316F461
MFGRFRHQPADPGGPPDLFAMPPVPVGHPQGLAAVPLDLLGAYLRHPVAEIRPLDLLGPEATGFIGNAIRKRLRDGGVGAPGLEPGEIVAGQNAARIARMRAQGMPEEQIRQIQAMIAAKTAEHQASGWTVRFANETYASVHPQAHGGEGTAFEAMRERYRWEHTRAGAQERHENLFAFAIVQVRDAPYESYHDGGALTAGGRAHDVAVRSAGLHSNHFTEILAGLAAVTLRVLGS